jgi:hypothetical protein
MQGGLSPASVGRSRDLVFDGEQELMQVPKKIIKGK